MEGKGSIKLLVLGLCLFMGPLSGVLFCQRQNAIQSRPAAKSPSVTYKFFNNQLHPPRYEITIHADGSGSYESQDDAPVLNPYPAPDPAYQKPPDENANPQDVKGDIYRQNFQATPALKEKIFELAKTADYFHGDFEYRKHPIAFTGKKTLVYSGEGKTSQATYNWSDDQAILDLTGIFTHISYTFEFGHRLAYEYRFERLELNQELVKMQDMASRGELAELHVLAPLLRQLAADRSIIHVAQERAARLLKLAVHEEDQLKAADADNERQ